MLHNYFQLAKSASLMSTHPKYKMGAVIINKKPVAVGCNLYKTHPIFANNIDNAGTIHAEVKAILSCPRSKLQGSEIWVYREDSKGNPAMAKPCKHCQKIILEAGIKRIYYTVEGGYERIDL
jgi:deoxycytidylate deaminase